MTGVVTRDSAQRRPIDKHRLDARISYKFADRLSPARPPATAAPCLILTVYRPIRNPAVALVVGPDAHRGRPGHRQQHVAAKRVRTSCLRHHLPDNGFRVPSVAPCGESGGDFPHRSDFVRVRARHGPRPGRRRPRTRRFPTPRRVRPPPDGNTTPAPDVRSVFFPAGPIMAGSTSGHGKLPRRRRCRVIRQDRSASGGPAQQVDTVTAVASPAFLPSCKMAPSASRVRSLSGSRRCF